MTRPPRLPGSRAAHEHALSAGLALLRIHHVPCWRVNQRPVLTKRGWRTPGADEGFPDAVAVLPPEGLAVALEAKSGGSRLNAAQKRCREEWLAAGGAWLTFHDVAELARHMSRLTATMRLGS